MMYAADYRRISRESLKGKWGIGILGCVLASVLGGVTAGGLNFNFNFEIPLQTSDNAGTVDTEAELAETLTSVLDAPISEEVSRILTILGGVVLVALVIGIAVGVAWSILAGVVRVGYCRFNLDLIEKPEKPEIGTIFRYFDHWKTAFCAFFLQNLYVILWTFLLIIPGIVAAYSYAMTGYILSENPELTAREAIARSKELMRGNRWRLFCLEISFIGWDILCVFTAGIGQLWLTPYKQAAYAAFYRDISMGCADRELFV